MRLTHSFWSKPSLENRWGIKNSFFSNIWIAALSCIYAKNSGNYITMHSDSYSYKYLKHFPLYLKLIQEGVATDLKYEKI